MSEPRQTRHLPTCALSAVLVLGGCSSFATAQGGTSDGGDAFTRARDGSLADAPPARDAPLADASPDGARNADAASADGGTVEGPLEGGVPESGLLDGSFGFDASLEDVITIGPPDAPFTPPDSGPDGSALDACGICDREWTCNGFTDTWKSEGPKACGDVRSGTVVVTLYCENGDTIDFPSATGNDGTWAVTSTGLALYFNGLAGTMEIDCVPGP